MSKHCRLQMIIGLILGSVFLAPGIQAQTVPENVGQEPAQHESPAAVYEDAVKLYQQQKYSEALLRFYKLEEIRPNYQDARHYVSRIEEYLSFKEKQRLAETAGPVPSPTDERMRKIEDQLLRLQEKEPKGPAVVKDNPPQGPGVIEKPIINMAPVAGPVVQQTPPQESEEKKARKQAVLEKRKQKLARKAQIQERKDLVEQINETYREALASYKAGLFTTSRDEQQRLSQLLEEPNLPEKFRSRLQQRSEKLDGLLKDKNDDLRAHDRYLNKVAKKNKDTSSQSKLTEKKPPAPIVPAPDREGPVENLASTKAPAVMPESVINPKQKKLLKQQADRKQKLEERAARKRQQEQKQREQQVAQEEAAAFKKSNRGYDRVSQKQREALRRQESALASKQIKTRDAVIQQKKTVANSRISQQQELQQGVDDLYCDAIVFYAQGAYDRSAQLMKEVDRLWPNYKLCRSYLEMIRRQKNGESVSPEPVVADQLSLTKDQMIQGALDSVEHSPRTVSP